MKISPKKLAFIFGVSVGAASYISDITNNHIWFLNRDNGEVIGQIGQMGHNAGEFFGLHMEAVDSKGNIYTGEVFGGAL